MILSFKIYFVMERKELDRILETLDVLKMLSAKAYEELSHLADYMIAWGGYVFVNMLLEQFLERGFWIETLFIPPMLAVFRLIGLRKAILIWIWGYVAMYGTFFITRNVFLTTTVVILAFFVLTYLSYRVANLKEPPFHISPYVGITWLVIWMSMFFIMTLFELYDKLNILFTYAIGLGAFITGFLHKYFFYLGIYALFILPVVLKFAPQFFPLGYSLLGLGMLVLGVALKRKA